MFDKFNDNEVVKTYAPLVGAAAGSLAITAAVERYGVPREKLAFAGAAAAFVMAQNGEAGAIKSALTGAAAAGVCIGIIELLEQHRPKFLFGDKPRRDAAPMPSPDAISRDDLAKALSDLQVQLTAQAREREEALSKQLSEMGDMVRDLVRQLKEAHAEINRLHAEAARRRSRDAARRARMYSVPPERPSVAPSANDNHVATQPPSAVEAQATAEIVEETSVPAEPASPSAVVVTTEEIDSMPAVYALLDAEERKQLSTCIAALPSDEAEQLRAKCAGADPRDVAATLRVYLSNLRNAS